MLNGQTIHVRNIERSVGPGLGRGGSKPRISAGKKFMVSLRFRSRRKKAIRLGLQSKMTHQVVNRFADENMLVISGKQNMVSVWGWTACRCHKAPHANIIEPLKGRRYLLHPFEVSLRSQMLYVGTQLQIWGKGTVSKGSAKIPQPIGVVVTEPMPPIVSLPPILSLPFQQGKGASVR